MFNSFSRLRRKGEYLEQRVTSIYSSKKPPLFMEDISKNVPIPNFNSSSEIFKGKDCVIWVGVPSFLDDVWEGGGH